MARRNLQGSRVLITGASSGIGEELARQLAAAGGRILITARRRERLESLAKQIQESGGQTVVVIGDLCDAETRRRLLDTAEQQFGGLDILINNAGVGAVGTFQDAAPDRLRRIMELNFFAPAELIRDALPLLKTGSRPMIVNVGSVLGHRAVPKKSEYCASKFALHGFSDALRAELAPQGIEVLLVSPSTTRSEFFDNVIENKDTLPWLKLGGTSSEWVARKTLQAIRRGRQEVILTIGGKLLVWADRICPPLVNRLVARFG